MAEKQIVNLNQSDWDRVIDIAGRWIDDWGITVFGPDRLAPRNTIQCAVERVFECG